MIDDFDDFNLNLCALRTTIYLEKKELFSGHNPIMVLLDSCTSNLVHSPHRGCHTCFDWSSSLSSLTHLAVSVSIANVLI